jgi:molybdate/tungstate transport system ATP-binding protein
MKNIFSVDGSEECRLGNGECFAVPGATFQGHVALRPEDVFVSLREDPSSEKISLPGTLLAVWHEGFSWFADVSCGNSRFTAALDRQFLTQGRLDPGQSVWLGFTPESLHFMSGC